jgi:hypothetical protein
MSTETNQAMPKNPLVGKTVAITYETGFPGTSVEINFFSDNQKTSTGRGTSASYFSTDNYEMAIVAGNIYMVFWIGNKDGHVVTAVWNFDQVKAYGSYSNPGRERIFMTGIINEIRE